MAQTLGSMLSSVSPLKVFDKMGLQSYEIILDNPTGAFYPGQVISGRVLLRMDTSKKVRAVEIQFKGRAKVKWTVGSKKSVTYTGVQQYLLQQYKLVGTGQEFDLPAGEHVYPFSATLPYNLASTFSGEFGAVRYTIKSKMDIPWALDKKAKIEFTVVSPFDLNTNYAVLSKPITDEAEKTFCCLFCASGPLSMKVHLPKSGFGFGQSIPVTVEVNNTSNVEVSNITCSLEQHIKWTANDPKHSTRYTKTKLVKLELGNAPMHSPRFWNEVINVPSVHLPNLSTCNVIQIAYYVKVNADPSGIHTDLDIEIPVSLGDIPLRDEYETQPPMMSQNQFGFPNYSPSAPLETTPGVPRVPLAGFAPSQ